MTKIDRELFEAVWDDDLDAARDALDQGANVNAKNIDGWTPLHSVTWYDDTELAALLIERGADVKAKDIDGKTPLDWAKYCGHDRLAELLCVYRVATEILLHHVSPILTDCD